MSYDDVIPNCQAKMSYFIVINIKIHWKGEYFISEGGNLHFGRGSFRALAPCE